MGMLMAPAAQAYRTLGDLPATRSSKPIVWPESTLVFELSTVDLPADLPASGVAGEALIGIGAWQSPQCLALNVRYDGKRSAPARLGDGYNTIQFVTSGWTKRGYLPAEAGVTELDYVKGGDDTWAIAEADLFVNAEHYRWSIEPTAGARTLRSLFIHEGGHMLGLLHPCEDSADDVLTCIDDDGNEASAMYPYYDATQLTLSADDEAGICFLYGGERPDQGCSESPSADEPDADEPGAPIGDPCDSADACASGVCSKKGLCESPLGELGTDCSTATDCHGGHCLAGVEEGGVCTNACESNDECTAGWICTPVDDERVCAPPDYAPSGGGCAVSAAPPLGSSGPWLLGLAALLLASRRQDRNRIFRRDTSSSTEGEP